MSKQHPLSQPAETIATILRKEKNWEELWFYQKTVTLYQLTYRFTQRFSLNMVTALWIRWFKQPAQASRTLLRGWLTA